MTSWDRPNLPSVADILGLPQVLVGQPEMLAAASHLTNHVRWVHTHENPDIAPLLAGGELLLTTGIMLPENQQELEKYVESIVAAGASGLIVEAGRRFERLPSALVLAAERANLPLILLHERVPFVAITEAANGLIVSEQSGELKERQAIEETFDELAVEGASFDKVVREAANLLDCPVVLENLVHQIVAFEPSNIGELFIHWEPRSRRSGKMEQSPRVTLRDRWLSAPVGRRGEAWGRLVAVLDHDHALPREIAVVERAAVTLSMSAGRSASAGRERHAQDALLAMVTGDQQTMRHDIEARCRTLGLPVVHRVFAGAMIGIEWENDGGIDTRQTARAADFVDAIAEVTARKGIACIVGLLSPNLGGALLSMAPDEAVEPAIERFASAVHGAASQLDPAPQVVVGIGSVTEELVAIRGSLREAAAIVHVAGSLDDRRPWYRLHDLRLKGLVAVLRDDPRLQTFVEAELGKVIDHDQLHGTQLVRTLREFLISGGNKAVASRRLGISRPTLYERLLRIENILGVSIGNAESQLALHMAVLSLEALRSGKQGARSSTPNTL